jgi:ribosomal protein S18 acetylase RimI-like enzyme
MVGLPHEAALVVRDATSDDTAALLAVEEAFRQEGAPEWSIQRRETFEFKVRAGSLIVAVLDERLVGYLMWTLLWGFPFVEYARVVPEHRNRGIGTRLLDRLVHDAAEGGHPRLWSSTSDADALRWHERNGFHRVGEIEWIWGRAHELMLIKELHVHR